jgi:hypothetical protein
MRFFLLAMFWALMLYSCKEVTYREPQPAGIPNIKEVPESLRGMYQTLNLANGDFSDTLIIESWGYHMKDKNDKDWLGRGTISDTMVVKFYKDYYFVNFKEGDQWILRLVKRNPSGAVDFLSIDLDEDGKRKENLKKLSKKMKVKEIKRGDNTFYQINPTVNQLMQLIKDGYFTGPRLNKIKTKSKI